MRKIRVTPESAQAASTTSVTPRGGTTATISWTPATRARTASRVSGSLPARRGSSGLSASNGGTASRRIIPGPRGNTFEVLHLKRMEPVASPPITFGLLAVVVLVLANAFFVAGEFALVGA